VVPILLGIVILRAMGDNQGDWEGNNMLSFLLGVGMGAYYSGKASRTSF